MHSNCFLFYVISAWEWFNGNAIFSDSGEYVYMIIHLKICSKSRNLIRNILALKEKKIFLMKKPKRHEIKHDVVSRCGCDRILLPIIAMIFALPHMSVAICT